MGKPLTLPSDMEPDGKGRGPGRHSMFLLEGPSDFMWTCLLLTVPLFEWCSKKIIGGRETIPITRSKQYNNDYTRHIWLWLKKMHRTFRHLDI